MSMEREDLAEELQRLANEDLAVRQRLLDAGELFGGYHPEMRAVHRRNGDRLEMILNQVGSWPGYRLVGKKGSEAAFVIAQHDIANPSLLRRSQKLYAIAVKKSDADPRRLANFEDRICYFEGRFQRYGTHVGWDTTGEFGPWPPVEEPDQVDKLRAKLGLGPLAEAVAEARMGHPLQRPVSEVLADHDKGEAFARLAGWRDQP